MITFLMFSRIMISGEFACAWLHDNDEYDDDDYAGDDISNGNIRENLRALGSTRDLSLLEKVANRPPLARPAEVHLHRQPSL